MSYIEIKNLSKCFGTRRVLSNVSLSIDEGEFVTIVGTSASGKTTLMRIVSGLETADDGAVTIAGVKVDGFPRGASIVFQNYSLLPWLSALENVRLAVDAAFPDWTPQRRNEQARKYLGLVGLDAAHAKKPRQLSGGMRQRVAIARAFAVEPCILFLDEPFGALDALTRATLQQELAKLCEAQEPRATVLMISNSVEEAVLLSNRVLALESNSTGSSLSAAAAVTLPRPRRTDAMLHDEEAIATKALVSEMLIAGHKRTTCGSGATKPAARTVMVEA